MKVKKISLIFFTIYLMLFFYLLSYCDFTNIYYADYLILIISYLVIGGILLLSISDKNSNIFEPINIVLILLINIFSVAPIILTNSGVVSLYGNYFMDGCLKATLIYMVSTIACYIGYKSYTLKSIRSKKEGIYCNSSNKILKIMFIIWCLCFSLALLYEVKVVGISISYILSVGLSGNVDATNITTPLSFIVNFSYSLIIPWIYIFFVSRNKFLKIGITFLMIALYIICGYRFILVIMVLAYLVVHFTLKKKNPKFMFLVSWTVILLVATTLIGNVRYDLKSGSEVNWVFNSDTLLSDLETNFNIYQPFYGIVTHYPSQYGYQYGKGMVFDTLITFVPRSIWSSKPLARDYVEPTAVRRSVGNEAIDDAAMAIPNIGEIYIDFGITGTIIIMFFFGRILKWSTKLYRNKKLTFNDLVLYSPILGLTFQLVTRGYMPNNFYLIIFIYLPGFILVKNEKNRLENSKKVKDV